MILGNLELPEVKLRTCEIQQYSLRVQWCRTLKQAMFYPQRSVAGALAWGLTLSLLQLPSGAFLFRGHSVSSHYLARSQLELVLKHEVNSRTRCPATNELSRKLALRGGAFNVRRASTQEEFEDVLTKSGDALVCVDFTATWCSPCQRIAPAFEQLSQELTDVVFVKVDVDENEGTTQKYDVYQMPTFLFMRNGEVVDQFSGANAAVLRQKIELLMGSEDGKAIAHDHEQTDGRAATSGLEEGAEPGDEMEVPGEPSGELGHRDPNSSQVQ